MRSNDDSIVAGIAAKSCRRAHVAGGCLRRDLRGAAILRGSDKATSIRRGNVNQAPWCRRHNAINAGTVIAGEQRGLAGMAGSSVRVREI